MKYFKNLYYKLYGKFTGKKYILKKEGNLYRIIYVKNITLYNSLSTIKIGELGGKVDSRSCLSHKGKCYIDYYSIVINGAKVLNNSKIEKSIINGNIKIEGDSTILESNLTEVKGEIINSKVINSTFNKIILIKNSVIKNSTINGNINKSCIIDSNLNDATIYKSTVFQSSLFKTFIEISNFNNSKVKYSTIALSNIKNSTIEYVNIESIIINDAIIKSIKDFIVFKNWWSSGRYFTWTRSNNMWNVGCFHGTGEELINKAYKASPEKGKEYEKIVNYVNNLNKLDN